MAAAILCAVDGRGTIMRLAPVQERGREKGFEDTIASATTYGCLRESAAATSIGVGPQPTPCGIFRRML